MSLFHVLFSPDPIREIMACFYSSTTPRCATTVRASTHGKTKLEDSFGKLVKYEPTQVLPEANAGNING